MNFTSFVKRSPVGRYGRQIIFLRSPARHPAILTRNIVSSPCLGSEICVGPIARLFSSKTFSECYIRSLPVPLGKGDQKCLFSSEITQNPTSPPSVGHARNDDYESWNRAKARLLDMELGTFESAEWILAGNMLKLLRAHPSLGLSQRRLEDGFSIIDRLCQETELHQPTSETSYPLLDQSALMSLLMAWRDYVISSQSTQTASQNGIATSFSSPKTLLAEGELSTASVWKRVKRYIDCGVVQAHPMVYNMVIHVTRKADDPKVCPHQAQEVFDHMLTKSANNPTNTSHHPDGFTAHEMIQAWARSRLPEAPQQAEKLLEKLRLWFKQTQREDFRPRAGAFCSVIEAHGHSKEPLTLERIQELFIEMKEACDATEIDVKVHTRVCRALAACDHPDSPNAARAILDKMCELSSSEGLVEYKPDYRTFSSVVMSYARAGRNDEAIALLEYMERLVEESGDPSTRPDKALYDALIWQYAKIGDPKQAEAVFGRMVAAIEQGQNHLQLNEHTWVGVLTSWAESKDGDASDQILRIMEHLKKLAAEKKLRGGITVSTYNPLLRCFARQSTKGSARAAERWFRWLEAQEDLKLQPDRNSVLNLVAAWDNARDPDRCETILSEIKDRYQKGTIWKAAVGQQLIDYRLFQSVVDGLAKSKQLRAAEKANALLEKTEDFGFKPDAALFNSVLLARAQSYGDIDHAEQVERLFRKMVQRWKEGNTAAKPNSKSFYALIYGLCRSSNPDALNRAEKALRLMRSVSVEPDNKTYEVLMEAWMERKNTVITETYFQEMRKGFEAGNKTLKPRFEAHVTRLQAWSNEGDPDMASTALREWVSAYEAWELTIDQKPKTKHFNLVLQSWLRSNREDAPEQAESRLREMFDLAASNRFDCRPDAISFTTVISTLTKLDTDLPAAAEKALALFNELKKMSSENERVKTLKPNLITYGETIVALIRWRYSKERLIVRLLKDMQECKDRSFWKDKRSVNNVLKKIKRTIFSSYFRENEALIAEYQNVELAATRALKR